MSGGTVKGHLVGIPRQRPLTLDTNRLLLLFDDQIFLTIWNDGGLLAYRFYLSIAWISSQAACITWKSCNLRRTIDGSLLYPTLMVSLFQSVRLHLFTFSLNPHLFFFLAHILADRAVDMNSAARHA